MKEIINKVKVKAHELKDDVGEKIRLEGNLRDLRRNYVPVAVEFRNDPTEAKKIRRRKLIGVGIGLTVAVAGAAAVYNIGYKAGAEYGGANDGNADDKQLANTYDYSDV